MNCSSNNLKSFDVLLINAKYLFSGFKKFLIISISRNNAYISYSPLRRLYQPLKILVKVSNLIPVLDIDN